MHCLLTNESHWLHSKKLVDKSRCEEPYPKTINDHEVKSLHLIEQSEKFLAVILYPNTK